MTPPTVGSSPAPAHGQQNTASWKLPVAIAAAVTFLLIGALSGNDDSTPNTEAADDYTLNTAASTTTTTEPTTTTTTSTTTATTTEETSESAGTTRPSEPESTERYIPPPPPEPEPEPHPDCDPNYSGCVPVASDVDCAGGSGDGPAYVSGPIRVIGSDIYRLDHDNDGIACE